MNLLTEHISWSEAARRPVLTGDDLRGLIEQSNSEALEYLDSEYPGLLAASYIGSTSQESLATFMRDSEEVEQLPEACYFETRPGEAERSYVVPQDDSPTPMVSFLVPGELVRSEQPRVASVVCVSRMMALLFWRKKCLFVDDDCEKVTCKAACRRVTKHGPAKGLYLDCKC